ncbi:MAG: NAD-dependent epimerase/dehydratase family protein [Elusimicrobia bacterium]|jgi:UDP-glucose 4-epimerase|nr:NAD-dependent epimerase/dehydratase family protein [Elusimicrobiota bacterium]
MIKKAVVTGGLGFIGSHLSEALLGRGVATTIVDNASTGRLENIRSFSGHPLLKVIHADVASDDLAEGFTKADVVFHLAGLADIVPSIQRPLNYCRTNITGTLRVLEAARHAGVFRIVYAASSSCYGLPSVFPTPETAPISPQYPYALSKWMGEEAVHHWGRVYGLQTTSLRLFNVYGPRSRTTGAYGAVFGVFLAQKLAGKPLTIVGDGTQRRDFIYVTDVVDAFLAAGETTQSGGVFNVARGNPIAVNELARLVGGPRVEIPKRPGEPDVTHGDIQKIKSVLGWAPRISFDEGVARVMAHLEDWRNAPVWTPASIAEATADWFAHLGKGK